MEFKKQDTSSRATNTQMPFSKRNYLTMIIGIVVILSGFLIMTFDTEAFGFGLLGLTVGPIITVIGFLIEFWAILSKPQA
ncbi:Protein of unknown function (DUF3098) [Dyadobacter jejuensis]|uniref:DUF3098 family protein n=1 Tax=Dyadobacter jejuensis TaxID=1082580 RepID=A0A316AHH3_9BACT|nr:DUF3098 domain-containing protein [Dyadobacter jejuensis]PWJ56719.1 Protein of unknown function (DUF3098) [Dyadobacter jejuensis]